VLRLWQQGDAVVCEFTDRGHITDPLAGRRTPSLTSEGGRGLWLANQLCDLVQIRSGGHGTTVRLLTWL
jgi:anti-sigma regulatory factor (Ser/Thr protein kinase)